MKRCINTKIHGVFFSIIVGLTIFMFLLVSGKIHYGFVDEKYVDTDVFSSFDNRELNIEQKDIIEQEITLPQGTLKSFSLKYHRDLFEPGLEIEIELCDEKNGKVLRKWVENGSDIEEDGFREYSISTQIAKKINKAELKIKANKNTNVLYCSQTDSLNGERFYINGEEQQGDLIIRLVQNKYVVNTLFFGAAICVFVMILCYLIIYYKLYRKILKAIKKIVCEIQKLDKVTMLKEILSMIAIFLLSFLIEKMISHYNVNTINDFNEYRLLFFVAFIMFIYLFVKMKAYIVQRPECVFITLLFIVGALYVIIMPAEAEISWDEAIHYWRAVGVSHALTGKTNIADSWVYWHSGIGYMLPNSIENLRIGQSSVQALYDSGKMVAANTDILGQMEVVAYLPSAIGLIIGRVLHLPHMIIFHLGAAMNMLLYIILVYYSVKRLKSGKMICITVASVLNCVFLASVYSSDSWITGFCMLGTTYFIGVMQEEGTLCKKDMLIMLGAYSLAFMPKAIYFPLFLIFMLLPREKFETKRQYVLFRVTLLALCATFCLEMVVSFKWFAIIFLTLWIFIYYGYRLIMKLKKKQLIYLIVFAVIVGGIIGYFVIAYLLPKMLGTGDLRGGSEVNSAGQVQFVMMHPIQYTKILTKFILGKYLSFQNDLQMVFNTFGYLGQSFFGTISFIFLWFVAFTDKRKCDSWVIYNRVKMSMIVLQTVIMLLIATALYISFTPVGYESVNGCQARYLLPLYPGFFLMIGTNKMRNEISEKIYNGGIIVVNILILLLSAWQVVVKCYY